MTEDHIKRYVGIIRNFLNYLLHHDVCPEYREQVEASRKICDQAEHELWQIAQVQALLPGTFNMACSEIFGGTYQGMFNEASLSWMNAEDKKKSSFGISAERARKVFKIGFAANATNEQISKYKEEMKGQQFSITNSQEISLEVTETILGGSIPDIQALYNSEHAKGLPILGKLKAKTWQSPAALDEDLTEEEEAELANNPPPVKGYEFWVEDDLLEKIFVGMKFGATVKQLSFGPHFFDACQTIHPSYFSFLPNEMMQGWREIEKEWLPPRLEEDGSEQQNGAEQQGSEMNGIQNGVSENAERKLNIGVSKVAK